MFDIFVPRSGASYSQEFEWREAAHWAGSGSCFYWRQFCALDGDEQAGIVAHYRASKRLDSVIAHDMRRHS